MRGLQTIPINTDGYKFCSCFPDWTETTVYDRSKECWGSYLHRETRTISVLFTMTAAHPSGKRRNKASNEKLDAWIDVSDYGESACIVIHLVINSNYRPKCDVRHIWAVTLSTDLLRHIPAGWVWIGSHAWLLVWTRKQKGIKYQIEIQGENTEDCCLQYVWR